MGSHRVSPPLVLRPRPSGRLASLVLATHVMAFAVILALPLGWSAIPLMLVVVIGLLDALLVKVLMLAPWSIRAANWHTDGSWRLTLVQGREVEARLSPTTFVGLGCIALVFELGRWRWSTLPLCSDSLDAETLRRLRQRLQIEGGRRDTTPGAA